MAKAALLGLNPLWVMRTRNPAEQQLLRAVIDEAEKIRERWVKNMAVEINNARVRAQRAGGRK